MNPILDCVRDLPAKALEPGETLFDQGEATGKLFVLAEGVVEIVKDGVVVAKAKEPGAIFGDLAALLGVPHTAAVRAVQPSRFHIVEAPMPFLHAHPAFALHLCTLLARRLDAMNQYLVDVKRQFVGHDHIALVDQMLDTLMNRQPRSRIAPKASTLLDPEAAS